MQAITIIEPGGPDQLVWGEVPDPVAGEGEVLVEVAATAVNRADLMQRIGRCDAPPDEPTWPGLECSGRIVGLGDGVGEEVGISPGVHSTVGANGASMGPGYGWRMVEFSSSSRSVHSSIQAPFASSHVGRSSSQPARSR